MNHNEQLKEIQNSPDGPHIGALFDFDGTIIAGYSATAMLQEKFKRREMGPEEILETANVMAQYSLGNMGFSGLMMAAAKFMKGVTEQSYFEFGEELYEKHISRRVYPESRELIEAHIAKGHTVAIVSSATIYQIEATARDLNIDHVLCSQYEVENGEFTGNIVRPLCFGEGKVIAAEGLAEEYDVDLDRSYFYSDSDDDIELLERVGKPRPLNPNKKLSAIAEDRGWPMQKFDSKGQGTASEYIRSIYATGSLVGSFLAGLPILGLTGSQREARNFSTSMFGDVAAALVGMELEIEGEANLWAQRPAVFVFNHQSKADVMILAKLIRKDMAGVGKQEIRSMPIIGQIMEYAGAVFIDRKNAASAIEAMRPLVDAMQVEGKSVVIAPEGTRSLSPKLLPFKKGAFHLAMQAGVPVVPIVIHNAGDIAHKHDFVMRSAKVKVTVLPPVETTKWTRRTVAKHAEDIRNLFLDVLGQRDMPMLEDAAGGEEKLASAKPASVKPRTTKAKTAAKGKSAAKDKTSVTKKTTAKSGKTVKGSSASSKKGAKKVRKTAKAKA